MAHLKNRDGSRMLGFSYVRLFPYSSWHPSHRRPWNFLLCATFRGLAGVGSGNNVPPTAFFTWHPWLSWLLTFFRSAVLFSEGNRAWFYLEKRERYGKVACGTGGAPKETVNSSLSVHSKNGSSTIRFGTEMIEKVDGHAVSWTVLQLLHGPGVKSFPQSNCMFAETPIFADCKVTKWVRKKIVCLGLSYDRTCSSF